MKKRGGKRNRKASPPHENKEEKMKEKEGRKLVRKIESQDNGGTRHSRRTKFKAETEKKPKNSALFTIRFFLLQNCGNEKR